MTACVLGKWEIALALQERMAPKRYMEGTFLNECGTLENHQQLFKIGFHPSQPFISITKWHL
jgi:hypothetical protein